MAGRLTKIAMKGASKVRPCEEVCRRCNQEPAPRSDREQLEELRAAVYPVAWEWQFVEAGQDYPVSGEDLLALRLLVPQDARESNQ